MQILTIIVDAILAAYITREVIRFVPRYRQLKLALAQGDGQARARIYREALAFEWISALLALIALGFDWQKLNPRFLALEGTGMIHSFSLSSETGRGWIGGVCIGVAAGTAAMIVGRMRANRRAGAVRPSKRAAWLRKLMPDFSALIPVSGQERLLWAAVAVSAGLCEEVVFRGWLLATLHNAGVPGMALIVAGAVAFGLAHAYQGISGILLTAFAGAFFCLLYVETGSLLVPILLHMAVDLRFAFLPAPRVAVPQPACA
jgi:uncharacterized protein